MKPNGLSQASNNEIIKSVPMPAFSAILLIPASLIISNALCTQRIPIRDGLAI